MAAGSSAAHSSIPFSGVLEPGLKIMRIVALMRKQKDIVIGPVHGRNPCGMRAQPNRA